MSETTGSLAEHLAEAARLHEAGLLEEAGVLYELVLAAGPENADAPQLSDLVALSGGRTEAGLARVCRADSHLLLGQMLRAEGLVDDAIASLRAASTPGALT